MKRPSEFKLSENDSRNQNQVKRRVKKIPKSPKTILKSLWRFLKLTNEFLQ